MRKSIQLNLGALTATTSPASYSFVIAPIFEDDVVNDVDFKLQDADFIRPPFLVLNPAPRAAAEIAYQRLISTGVRAGYIATYKKNFK